MNLLKKFNQAVGFTPTEQKVVVFLVVSFLAGVGVNLYRRATQHQEVFDYAKADSEFSARSQMLAADTNDAEEAMQPAPLSKSQVADNQIRQKIDINIATKDDLISLPGIGEAMAERIIIYREEHGRFSSMDDLLNIKGIGKKKLERIVPFCAIGN